MDIHIFLILLALYIIAAAAAAAEPYQTPLLNDPLKTSGRLIPPFTDEWTRLLEQFYNSLGGHTNGSSSVCPVTLPDFQCDPFFWEDGQDAARDARHLRPHSSRASHIRLIYLYM
ncbi:hypothetical protein BX666DRAFT_677818 [Dichotomocladium elegans]|nr:hypothetical protein BX666DRAFT_677818 [Dichotomocladium elegans]